MGQDIKAKEAWARFLGELYDIPAYSQAVSFYHSAGIEQYLPSRTDFLRKGLMSPDGTKRLDLYFENALAESFQFNVSAWMNAMRDWQDEEFNDAMLYEALEDYQFLKLDAFPISDQIGYFMRVYLPGAYLSGDLTGL